MSEFVWGKFSEKGMYSIRNSNSRINIWHGSVSSSKTVCSLVRWISFIKDGPPGALMMAGLTERTMERNILSVLQSMLGGGFKYRRGVGELTLLGRKIYILGANDERAEGKLRGMTLAGAYGDEIVLWPESFFTILPSRLRVPGAKFFGTTNPDQPYHYIKKDYIDRAQEEGLSISEFHFTLDDNPNLPPEYVQAIKKEYTGLWNKRFIQGLWVVAEGAIYDMFEDSIGTSEEPGNIFHTLPSSANYIRYFAVDYGTTNPCTILDIYDDGTTAWLTQEYYYDSHKSGRQKTDSQYADDLLQFADIPAPGCPDIPPVFIIIDPSAASFAAELRTRSLMVKEADNEVNDGIRVSASVIGHRLFRVHERCINFRTEINGYMWDDDAKDKGKEQPMKNNDHAMDAFRYYIKTIMRPWRLAKTMAMANVA